MKARAAALALLLLAACGGDEQVGGRENLEFDEQEAARLGEIEQQKRNEQETASSTAPPVTTTTAAPRSTAPPPTAAAATTVPPTTAAPAFTIKIVAGGQGFDPFSFAVRRGTRLTVQNTDSQPRSFTSDEAGAFDSGMIAPGGTFNFVAEKVGKFNFHDETRPFAVGQMEVTA